jgi:L-lysine 6-transaminase
MGVTGKWWAHQHFDVKPDILVFGKKSQVCGIMVGSKIDEVKDNVFKVSSRINSTWGGNLVDMVRSKKFIEIVKEESLIKNAEKVGKVLVDELINLSSEFPDMVSNPRGRGLMDAFDLKSEKHRDEFFDRMFSKGVLLLKAGELTIRLRPALILSEEDVKEFVVKAREVLKEMR